MQSKAPSHNQAVGNSRPKGWLDADEERVNTHDEQKSETTGNGNRGTSGQRRPVVRNHRIAPENQTVSRLGNVVRPVQPFPQIERALHTDYQRHN